MSALDRGFVRDSRFGDGPVIKGTNRETSRKWRALGIPDVTRSLVKPGICIECGAACCFCVHCLAHRGERCAGCARIPGVKPA